MIRFLRGVLALGLAAELFAAWPLLAQTADRNSATQSQDVRPNPSQRYRAITLRMSKEAVRRVMGPPNQSTDTLWLYPYADGTTVEVIFSKERRVTQVLYYKKQRQFPQKR